MSGHFRQPGSLENTRRWKTVGIMLGQRRRRWPSIIPAVGRRFVLDGWQHFKWSIHQPVSFACPASTKLFKCWASVEDCGPASKQHWMHVLGLLVNCEAAWSTQQTPDFTNVRFMLVQRLLFVQSGYWTTLAYCSVKYVRILATRDEDPMLR